ncbi:MAG: barstar family protein [Eubacteriales bacterium]|nr:barstar family protein [Eubacteriales bacterium]
MEIIILNANKMTDRSAAYSYLKSVMRLPEYFGENLDALADCLGEMPRGSVIILIDSQALAENLGDYGLDMIETFREISLEAGFSFIEE